MADCLLLIDDDALTREMLALLLTADGWKVVEAESGEQALAVARSANPSVVLCDLQLPGIHGAELANRLRAVAKKARLIAMTATVKDGAGEGFDALLRKPVDAPMVRSAVEGLSLDETAAGQSDLSEETYLRLLSSMPASRVFAFYRVAIEDADRRIVLLQKWVREADDASFRKEAHALKGGCGMVGAQYLSGLASVMEKKGIDPDTATYIQEFTVGLERLRSILSARENC